MAVLLNLGQWKFGHLTPIDLIRNILIGFGSYFFAWAASFGWNTVQAPVLLDRERASEIADLSAKSHSRESQKELHSKFAALMDEGKNLTDKVFKVSEFGPWIREREEWKRRVSQALTDLDAPTEAAAFLHAAEKAARMTGAFSHSGWQMFYRDEMKCYRDELREIVKRVLPYSA